MTWLVICARCHAEHTDPKSYTFDRFGPVLRPVCVGCRVVRS